MTKAKVKAKSKPKFKKKVVMKAVKVRKVGKLIGKITHYFSVINVGVIKLFGPLNVGDEIRIMGGENTDFNQKVSSMQIDHKELKKAKKGSAIGMKVSEKVREGYKVYKV